MGYRDGLLHIDLHDFSHDMQPSFWPEALKLKPGPGFGDLSHPSTRLVLKLMAKRIEGKAVLDVGCGSGILALAALSMGAASVCGIDIDQEALMHAEVNARLNDMQDAIKFVLPEAARHALPKEGH